jgi:hypothetical protein
VTDSGEGLTGEELAMVVYRFIGVSGGYLGDFSYSSHAEFYPVYCGFSVDTNQYTGTTRQRFISILQSLPPRRQAQVLRGLLQRFPDRDQDKKDDLLRIITRLEAGPLVPEVVPRVASEVVTRALADAENLLRHSGSVSAVDRVHTALHGYLRAVCDQAGVAYAPEASMTALFKALRADHPKLAPQGARAQDTQKILNAFASILDALEPMRNRGSVAHPNQELLGEPEALLAINAVRTLLSYMDTRLAGWAKSPILKPRRADRGAVAGRWRPGSRWRAT